MKLSTLRNLVFKYGTRLNMFLFYWLIIFFIFLKTINTLWVFLSTYLKPLMESINKYFQKIGIIWNN